MSIQTYTVDEIIAEKYRAMIQQVLRNRMRRQDVYDIAWLLTKYEPDDVLQATILQTLIVKCADRDIEPAPGSLDDPEIRRRSSAEWDAMRLEVGNLPDFGPLFDQVVAFY